MEVRKQQEENLKGAPQKHVDKLLISITGIFFILSIAIFGKTLYIKYLWQPNPRMMEDSMFRQQTQEIEIKPERGDILDCNGNILATSIPKYNIYMDCAIMKKEFSQMKKINHKTGGIIGEEKEKKWRGKLAELCTQLPKYLNGKSSSEYMNMILRARENGRRHLEIAKNIDHSLLVELKKLPLWNESVYYSGLIVETKDVRQYPYDKLARRVIGYVSNNESKSSIGIEGSFQHNLHGTPGIVTKKKTSGDDKMVWVDDPDGKFVPAKNGDNVKLTIDINIQDIADKALRRQVESDPQVDDACMIIMDVKSGAIKAMVNLHRGKNGLMDETENLAVYRLGEPGSVFKTVGLMSLLEDDKIKLDTMIPTNGGMIQNFPVDQTIRRYEQETRKHSISVLEGFEKSSNYVFTYLVNQYYRNTPLEYTSKIGEYKFGEKLDFELNFMPKPSYRTPNDKAWTPTDLGAMAYGYGISITPLHTLTFYNAIANEGKMMKPYLVEQLQKEDGSIETTKPIVLNGAICSKSTIDTLTKALRCVVTNGTGSRLRSAKLSVAGKTGTSRVSLTASELKGSRNPYRDINGNFRHQGTFVGFFPSEEPKYSAIVVIYSALSQQQYYGGTRPAEAFKEVVNNIYAMEYTWSDVYKREESMPEKEINVTVPNKDGNIVPNVKKLGLSEAIYTLENSGYKCDFSGVGKVTSQSPAAGSIASKGSVVIIKLE